MSKRNIWPALMTLAVSAVIGLLFAVQMRLMSVGEEWISWREAVTDALSFWLLWGLLATPIRYLARRFPINRQHRRNAFIHLAIAACVAPAQNSLYFLILIESGMVHKGLSAMVHHVLVPGFMRGLIYYGLIVAIVHALDYYQRYEENTRRNAQLEAQLVQAQLQALKMQLHPHFLFNTLNSISALLREDVEAADAMLSRLGDFLRLTLANAGTQDVTLQEELDFLECYLAIEQVRFQDRLTTRVEVEPQALDARIPNLILQPIVENAIRYGVARSTTPGRIEIRASRRNGALLVQVKDNGPGIESSGLPSRMHGEGLGLSNVRARLERLYGGAHRFELANAAEGGLVVTLEIPFQTAGTGT